ncbi:MAG: amidohydrolase family protein [Flavobacteriaceae bacterium]|nr:amidohydrolase family protein [Flavobacteriaceae bacterium]
MRQNGTVRIIKITYRIAGVKVTLDGSPQGRTAWRTIPYLLPPDGQKKGYKAYPAVPNDKDYFDAVDSAFMNDRQLLVHANGDAAIDQFISGLSYGTAQYGDKDRKDSTNPWSVHSGWTNWTA